MSSLLCVLAALLLSAPCAAFAVRGRGGDVVAAGGHAFAVRGRGGDVVAAGVSALAQPTAICGMTATAYSVEDFDASNDNDKTVGAGSFGVVHSIPRKISRGETLTPTETRVLGGDNRLAVKVAENSEKPEEAIQSATREAALGLLVCSGVGCPAGSPFPAFLGTQNKGAGPVALVTELVRGAELASVLARAPKDTDKTAWTDFLDAHALPLPAAADLRNLDGVLAAAAGMALALARLEEIGVVHHDIKPSNAMVGKGGLRVFDFGLACLGKATGEVNAAAGTHYLPSNSGACKLACTVRSPGGTKGYYSPAKLGFFGEVCLDSKQCTAEELRGVDLFALGMSLMELLAANSNVAAYYVLAPEDNACVKIVGSDEEQMAKKKKLTAGLPSLLSAYFSLGMTFKWATAGPAADAAARRRIYSYLATVGARGRYSRSILGGAPPLSYFSKAPPEKNLIVPRCFSSSSVSGPSTLIADVPDTAKDPYLLTLAAAPAPPPAPPSAPPPAPAPWTDGAAEEHLLSVPTSRALKSLLDVVRKLLAYDSRDGFANALEAVHAIDRVRELLAEEEAQRRQDKDSLAAFRGMLACFATETDPNKARAQPQPQPQAQLQTALAQPQAPVTRADCLAAAALAREQIAQRGKSRRAPLRPNEYDVAVALHDCERAAALPGPPPPPALLSQRAFGAIVGREACASRPALLGEPEHGAAPPPAQPLVDGNGRAIATEKLPFALAEGVSATWAKRLFFLQCDVLGAHDEPAGEGLGVWLHWSGGASGVGYVVQVHDTSTPPGPAPYTCRKHFLSSVTGPACKALLLRHATPRSGGGNERRLLEGLLRLYAPGNNNADALGEAINRFKSSHCGAGSAADTFRRLLAVAKDHQQPLNWQQKWQETAAQKIAEKMYALSHKQFATMGVA